MRTLQPCATDDPEQLELFGASELAACEGFADDERAILEAAREIEARHPRPVRWPAEVPR